MSAGDGNGREEMDEGKCNQVMRTPGRRERKEKDIIDERLPPHARVQRKELNR